MSRFHLRLRAIAVLALVGSAALLATPARAWWRGGVWIGVPPVVVAPPVYYPPVYYPPAYYPPYYPGAYAPPPAATLVPQVQNQSQSQAPVAYGSTCHAGTYVCGAPDKAPVGGGCSCPGLGAPSYGVVD